MHQPGGERVGRVAFERDEHDVDNVAGGEQVAGGYGTVAEGEMVCAQRARAGVAGDPPGAVDDGKLPVVGGGIGGDDRSHRLSGAVAGREPIEQPLAEARVGDVLRRGRADAGAEVDAAGGHGRAGRANSHAERAGIGAACGERERHDAAGRTAMASISTSHSGRASAETTSPVETGYTPLSQRPITRYTVSR